MTGKRILRQESKRTAKSGIESEVLEDKKLWISSRSVEEREILLPCKGSQ